MIGFRNTITDKGLLKLCRQFKAGVLGRKKSKDQCYRVCAPLHSYLSFLKIDCKLIEGYVTIGENITNHYWIELPDGRIVDPTADQFNEIKKQDMPKVYLGELPNWYMKSKKKKSPMTHYS